MAKTISITVPDDLHKRLQAVRDQIIVSQICQQAIEQAVSAAERRETKMEALERNGQMEQWREQKSVFRQRYVKMGEEAVLQFISHFTYDDFIAAVEIKKVYSAYDQSGEDYSAAGVARRIMEELGFMSDLLYTIDDAYKEERQVRNWIDIDKDAFYEGFILGAVDYYEEIEDEL